ncbi:unnamed protein product [Porites evermanni]|uniref:Uncharacterized protein n=1 Tax=Porites evermanni TaxID=104178 RepID=A0ABN8LJN9_9CNID|nr:unnamed protein product [Porites evermanni]
MQSHLRKTLSWTTRSTFLKLFFLAFRFPTFLLNSTYVLKAVDLSKECLILVNQKALKMKLDWLQLKLRTRYITDCFKGIYQKAKELYAKALSFMVHAGEKTLELSCYGNMGTLHWSMGKYSEAKEYLEKHLP